MTLATDTRGLFNGAGLNSVAGGGSGGDQHPRLRILDLVVARLRTCVVDPKRVSSDPREPFQDRPGERELPALNVFAEDESSLRQSKTAVLTRAFDLVVDVLADGPEPARAAHQIAWVVENILSLEGFDTPACADLVVGLTLLQSAPTYPRGGDQPFCSLRMTFAVEYQTEFGTTPNV